MKTYTNPTFPYRRCADQDAPGAPHPVVVVGAGPVGMAAAIDLAQRGVPVVVVDDDETVSVGSRAICYAKRALEILDRLGVGQRIVDKGVGWNVGRVFFRDAEAYRFDLLPEAGHRRPAFVNLQQYWLEEFLVERCAELPAVDLRWRHKVTGVVPHADGATLTIDTPDGPYALQARWVIACDGARSPVRNLLGLESEGQVFRDRFLIADIHMRSDFPTERWFWFDPPFHPNQSVLLHRQADDVWRIDFQLGWDADPEEEKKPERILPRLRAMLGPEAKFDIEWASVYTFQCRRMKSFRHGRVLFAGDAAHLVSPFGARGANSGFQDTDNLAWKLALVLDGKAPERLLDSYDAERTFAADENILNSTRSTDFITPKSRVSRTFRDAVLQLAKRHPFARRLVNSGRLSVPAVLATSPLNAPDVDAGFASGPGAMVPGAPAADAPVRGAEGDWLLGYLGGTFTLLAFGDALAARDVAALAHAPIACRVVQVGGDALPGATRLDDVEGLAAKRYDARPGTVYLLRPDQHVTGRWRAFDAARVRAAIARATCND
ncbi:MAG TPA: FAD-dependent oxidoreductase [Casimicrobiaceae bacterium]|nr:FAD-dependent oxidoreductase [Casimicrobiaceae bacterium]